MSRCELQSLNDLTKLEQSRADYHVKMIRHQAVGDHIEPHAIPFMLDGAEALQSEVVVDGC